MFLSLEVVVGVVAFLVLLLLLLLLPPEKQRIRALEKDLVLPRARFAVNGEDVRSFVEDFPTKTFARAIYGCRNIKECGSYREISEAYKSRNRLLALNRSPLYNCKNIAHRCLRHIVKAFMMQNQIRPIKISYDISKCQSLKELGEDRPHCRDFHPNFMIILIKCKSHLQNSLYLPYWNLTESNMEPSSPPPLRSARPMGFFERPPPPPPLSKNRSPKSNSCDTLARRVPQPSSRAVALSMLRLRKRGLDPVAVLPSHSKRPKRENGVSDTKSNGCDGSYDIRSDGKLDAPIPSGLSLPPPYCRCEKRVSNGDGSNKSGTTPEYDLSVSNLKRGNAAEILKQNCHFCGRCKPKSDRYSCKNPYCSLQGHRNKYICQACVDYQKEYFGSIGVDWKNIIGDVTDPQWFCPSCVLWEDSYLPYPGLCCCSFRRNQIKCPLHLSCQSSAKSKHGRARSQGVKDKRRFMKTNYHCKPYKQKISNKMRSLHFDIRRVRIGSRPHLRVYDTSATTGAPSYCSVCKGLEAGRSCANGSIDADDDKKKKTLNGDGLFNTYPAASGTSSSSSPTEKAKKGGGEREASNTAGTSRQRYIKGDPGFVSGNSQRCSKYNDYVISGSGDGSSSVSGQYVTRRLTAAERPSGSCSGGPLITHLTQHAKRPKKNGFLSSGPPPSSSYISASLSLSCLLLGK
eukprot:jgi/Bigna1/76309/fgenesh1_pg.40_\